MGVNWIENQGENWIELFKNCVMNVNNYHYVISTKG